MTVAIDCQTCGNEVVFSFGQSKGPPKEVCECGAVYRLKVEKVGI